MKNKFQFAMTLAVVLAMLVTSLALADNVINDVTGSGTSTINTGDSTTVNYQLKALNDPSDPGSNKCNTTDGTPTLITILIPAGADVTATPASFTFTSCGTDVPVLFTSNTPGDYVINVDTTDTNDPDSAFNVVTAKFTLHVESLPPPSNTAPELTIPDSFSVEGNATGGANVSYSATATDAQQGSLTPSCSPASGAFFPLGTTTVNCTVTDTGGLSDTGFFNVTVVDTIAPVIAAHADVTAEATSSAGAVVNYTSPATTDVVSGAGVASCSLAPGSLFALGNTTVTCNASDGTGNSAIATTFVVHVVDTTKPVLTLPANIIQEATGPAGNVVIYSASATDLVDGSVAVTCTPPSGSTFPIATTTVNCSSSDSRGNTATGSFTVKVQDTIAPTINASATKPVASAYTADTWTNQTVTVHYACTDGGSGVASVTGDQEFSDEGVTTSTSGSCTDVAGNSASASFGPIKIDKTAPTISAAATTLPNAAGWYNSDVTVHFTCADTLSGVALCPADQVLGTEGLGVSSIAQTATDVAGNTSDISNVVTVNIDKTKPTISAAISAGTLGLNGWYVSDVTVHFTCADNLSGVVACPVDQVLSTEGTGISSTAQTIMDAAGNTSDASNVVTVNIDKTAPVLNITGAASGPYGLCSIPNRPTFAPSDAISGLDGTQDDSWTTSSTPSGVGSYIYSAQATDLAGNTTSETRSYSVTYGSAFGGFLQPINMDGTSRFKLGSTIPVKFQMMCNGMPISIVVAKMYVVKGDSMPDPGVDEAISTSAATTGNLFRYSDPQYIFNLSTKIGYLNPGATTSTPFAEGTWTLKILLDDGTWRSVNIQIKK